MSNVYPRDLIGYGRTPPDPRWPGQARIAVQAPERSVGEQAYAIIHASLDQADRLLLEQRPRQARGRGRITASDSPRHRLVAGP